MYRLSFYFETLAHFQKITFSIWHIKTSYYWWETFTKTFFNISLVFLKVYLLHCAVFCSYRCVIWSIQTDAWYLEKKAAPYHPFTSVPLIVFKHVQHGIVQGREEHGGLNLLVEEHAGVHFLQYVRCNTRHTAQFSKGTFCGLAVDETHHHKQRCKYPHQYGEILWAPAKKTKVCISNHSACVFYCMLSFCTLQFPIRLPIEMN